MQPITTGDAPGRAGRMRRVLVAAFEPQLLVVEDDSARHAGHAGARAGGETHYNLVLVSQRFAGLSRVARQRQVHEALAPEFAAGLHALSMTLRTPYEHAAPDG